MEEYKIAFEFMFWFVNAWFESYPEDDNVRLIYKKFSEIRKELKNGNKG